MHLPEHSPYVIAGAGIHGLSTAYHLALELRAKGTGDGADIVVLERLLLRLTADFTTLEEPDRA